jgi:hypothetical protein
MDISLTMAALQMNDYKNIRISPTYKKCRPSYTVVWHNQAKRWLQSQFENHKEEDIVVVTHHAPSINSIPSKGRNDPLRAAYASNMDEFVSSSKARL